MDEISGEVAKILELNDPAAADENGLRDRVLEILEAGGIIFLRNAGFELSQRERELIANASVTLPTRKERESRNGRPTVIYEPARDKLFRTRMKSPEREELKAILARYADWSSDIIHGLFPCYAAGLTRDRTTYRPCERASIQGLHVDASYGRPTGGRGMLRIFYNVNPEGQSRVWRIGEAFEPFARRYMAHAKVRPGSLAERALGQLGIVKGQRTAYDHLMEDIRGQGKKDKRYQARAPQQTYEFPPGSAWIAITDLVLHGAVSGQHSLDQTFFLAPEDMARPEQSSLRILERLAQTSLRR